MSFYRTYRPQVIGEIDSASVREQLSSLLKKKTADLPHAFFFSGPKGAGKTTAARIIAKLFLCEKPSKQGPCGTCDVCISISKGTNMDVLEMDAASNRGIEDVRELRERIALAPSSGKYKVYIIDEVHMMTNEAFNALLKTLEEPPAHAVFILATTDPQKVPITVRSRCLEIKFPKATVPELDAALKRIIDSEKIAIDKEAVSMIAGLADGAYRDAVKLLEQASFLEGTVTLDRISQLLSMSDESERKAFLSDVLVSRSESAALDRIERLAGQGAEMKLFLSECLRDLQSARLELLLPSGSDRFAGWKKEDVESLMHAFLHAFEDLRISPIPQLPIELAVAEWLRSTTGAGGLPGPSPVAKETPEVSSKPAPSKPNTVASVSEPPPKQQPVVKSDAQPDGSEHLNLEKLRSHWPDFIEALKPFNHSVAGVIRSARPSSVTGGVVTIEAFYPFHQERLSDPKVRDILGNVLKQLFGVKTRVEIVLGKK